MSSFLLMLFLLFNFSVSWGANFLPKNLNSRERTRALEILGFGTVPKVLDNPYPLGGYTGTELGIASEIIGLEDLSRLGTQTTKKGELNYYTLSFAKGLYYNVDFHLFFAPFIQKEKIQVYGGQLRAGFFEAAHFPLSLSGIVSLGGANFSNLINISTMGFDLVATVPLESYAIYFGVGQSRAIGRFTGGVDGITDDQEPADHDVRESHTLFGMNFDFSKVFLALEIDRYTDSIYSGKVGYRF